MKSYRGNSSITPPILKFDTRRGCQLNDHAALGRERSPHSVPIKLGNWLGPSTETNVLEKKKSLPLVGNQTPDRTTRNPTHPLRKITRKMRSGLDL
jgi:hypothetical protein